MLNAQVLYKVYSNEVVRAAFKRMNLLEQFKELEKDIRESGLPDEELSKNDLIQVGEPDPSEIIKYLINSNKRFCQKYTSIDKCFKEEKAKVADLKNKNYLLNANNKKKDMEIKDLEKAIDLNNAKIESLKSVIIEKDRLLEEYKFMKDSYLTIVSNNSKLRTENQKHLKRIQELKNRIENASVFQDERKTEIVELNKKLMAVSKELGSFKRKCLELEISMKFDAEKLIKELSKKITLKNLEAYKELPMLYTEYMTLDKELNGLIQSGSENNEESIYYGFVTVENNEYYFNTVSGEKYQAEATLDIVEDHHPAKASISNGLAVILELYDIKECKKSSRNDKNTKELNVSKSENKESCETETKNMLEIVRRINLAGLKILLVGSINKVEYRDRLEALGCTVYWHDPFEEGSEVLKNKFNKCDIAILCVRHISHSVHFEIDTNDLKVHTLHRDNTETLFALVRYAAIKLGLIETGILS